MNLVEKEGFTDLAALVRDKKKLKAGDKGICHMDE